MDKIVLKSYAKINLSIDVLDKLDNGYHKVEMIMQQIALYDLVAIEWEPNNQTAGIHIEVSTNRPYLPRDERNLAYKGAMLMARHYGQGKSGTVKIAIRKTIPVAAGLAGGSGNGAAVLLGLNRLWNLRLNLKELWPLGELLGADVPFCMMGQAKCNKILGPSMNKDPLAACCALARGIGTELEPIKDSLDSYLVLTKPPISVSTPEIYKEIDKEDIKERPDTAALKKALALKGVSKQEKNRCIEKNMMNILEKVTLKRYPIVMYTKNKLSMLLKDRKVLMSGSGPSLFALVDTKEQAMAVCTQLKKEVKETFWVRTMI